ncbi:hypothetical protein EJ03DRAFT_211592 [Teratosphaeria nubilosa]|uniref:Uncharacterized protein n=1 Tax=Teratosphaeria nubilosa TaxID=161662 RepID=A0A6G1LGN3_9PEZI|nr:hypothetical protein EJ03DRAFT_211592 [Teratosphaeria nubilosa]
MTAHSVRPYCLPAMYIFKVAMPNVVQAVLGGRPGAYCSASFAIDLKQSKVIYNILVCLFLSSILLCITTYTAIEATDQSLQSLATTSYDKTSSSPLQHNPYKRSSSHKISAMAAQVLQMSRLSEPQPRTT